MEHGGSSMALAKPKPLSLLLLLVWGAWGSFAASNKQTSVIIIGAGISGIMAAKTLSDNGVKDFLILEATDRIGGRMRHHNFCGEVIELGANWVEGVGGKHQNPIWKLAKKYNLRTFVTDFENASYNIYDERGMLKSSMLKTPNKMSAAELNYVEKLGSSKTRDNEEDISILTAQRLFGRVPTTPVEMVIDYSIYDFEFAEPPRITSLKNTQPNPTFVDFGEDEYFVADRRGYVHIVEELAKEFLMHVDGTIIDTRLQLHKVVRQIKYSNEGVKVVTEDGSVYDAEYAIVTVSIGVLQSNLIHFSPPLPEWKVTALYKVDMAIYTKIFLKFPYKFWPGGNGTGIFLYADGRRGYYPCWQHLDKELPQSNIIFVTVTDDESRRIEQQTVDETKSEIMVVLRHMFGKSVPDAEDILIPRWWKNPYFRGAYSNWPIGITESDFNEIKAPVGVIYFAGEHTDVQYNGYVHGAYLSGIEVAKNVLDCKNNGKFSHQRHITYTNVEERETTRYAWSKKVEALEEALKDKCQL